MTDFSKLSNLPGGVEESLELVSRFDQCLATGFSRLSSDERETLDDFSAAFAGSPLYEAVVEAKDRLLRSEFIPSAFLGLASGRSAILGAVHDSLQAQFSESTSIEIPVTAVEAHSQPPGEFATLLSSTQQWLLELAVSGFGNLEESQLTPFTSTLEQIQEERSLTGLSALLTGLLDEFLAGSEPDAIPVWRWSDLWSAAMLGSQQLTGVGDFEKISGDFLPLGVDVRIHQHVVAAYFYGVIDGCAARVPFTSYKVGVISGDEIWKLFRPRVDPFLNALEKHETVKIEAEFYSGGDLHLSGDAKPGEPVDPFAIEWSKGFGPVSALKRHPVQIAQLVKIPECTVTEESIAIDGNTFPLALDRITGGDNDLPAGLIGGATQMMALARFDNGSWRFQPLAIKGKPAKIKKGMLAGEGTMKRLGKLKGNTLEILQERAGKLLRE